MVCLVRPLVFRSFLIAVALVLLLILVVAPAALRAQGEEAPYVVLTGFAVLPADTFAPGPPSGYALDPEGTNNRRVPFDSQPVQGFSSVLPHWNGHYLALSDNGFGNKASSPDYQLRWYEVAPDFGTGSVEVVGYTELRDPNQHVPWPIVNGATNRVLTGGDFDLESFRQAPDGTFWFGEEFGPYLLHTDDRGRLLDPPYSTPYPAILAPFARNLPFIQSPDHPDFVNLASVEERRNAANLPSSKGFEGMALNTSGTMLYPLLEGTLVDDPVRTRLLIQEFSLVTKSYTGRFWFYNLSDPSHAIGDMTAINDYEFLVIERDQAQGPTASFKRIYKIDLRKADQDRIVPKELVVNLMAITDSKGLTSPESGAIGFGSIFTFPFVTIESVYPIDSRTLLVLNDNNYPFSTGRRANAPDNTEFIRLRLTGSNSLGLDR